MATGSRQRGHECYHCKQWIGEGEPHDCWTTTERALTQELSEDLRDAWERLRDAAVEFGEQRIYASHHSIMFARKACYFFVRPKRRALEVVFFLGRTVKAPQVRRTERPSRLKVAHVVQLTHRDQVESPVTDWLREAYDFAGAAPGPAPARATKRTTAGRTATTKAGRKKPARPKTPRKRGRR
jgi:hypothetical protein